jgi:hypothetical protein
MTRKRNDSHSTEFGLWLRDQPDIDSKFGYTATNLDYIWSNYNKPGLWMLIEEKRHNTRMTYAQEQQFKVLDNAVCDVCYRGFHLIVFEHTSPDDGCIYLDRKQISTEDLITFLQFKADAGYYVSLFRK